DEDSIRAVPQPHDATAYLVLIILSTMTRGSETSRVPKTAGRSRKTPDRHARRRERTRGRLVEAARTLFARQGVDSTPINEITEKADGGFGSFSNPFESKEAIVEAVLAETVAAQGAAIEAVTRDLDDPAEIVAAAHRYFADLARSDPDWAWLLVRLDVSHNVTLA